MTEAERLREFRSAICKAFCNRERCTKCPVNELDYDSFRRSTISDLIGVKEHERKVRILHH